MKDTAKKDAIKIDQETYARLRNALDNFFGRGRPATKELKKYMKLSGAKSIYEFVEFLKEISEQKIDPPTEHID